MKLQPRKHCRICFQAIIAFCAVSLFSCTAPLVQYYPDTFYKQDCIYENRAIGFTLTYRGTWDLETEPSQMSSGNRAFARELNRNGLELLYVGSTAEGFHGTRAIAANLNEPVMAYAKRIRNFNLEDNSSDSGLVPFDTEKGKWVKWVYEKSSFRFVEFFCRIETMNIRVAFWSTPEMFDRFLPVYEEIVHSMTVGRIPGRN